MSIDLNILSNIYLYLKYDKIPNKIYSTGLYSILVALKL